MKILVQKVTSAEVKAQGETVGSIREGLLVFLGIHKQDEEKNAHYLVDKLIHLRIFSDQNGKMNRSLLDIQGEVLVISQFTLYGNCVQGRRPDFLDAARPEMARLLYDLFVQELKKRISKVETGVFGAHMEVALTNNGPATFIIDSK